MKKFEYKTLTFPIKGVFKKNIPDLEEPMNELGRDGWDLVEVIKPMITGESIMIILLFKREL